MWIHFIHSMYVQMWNDIVTVTIDIFKKCIKIDSIQWLFGYDRPTENWECKCDVNFCPLSIFTHRCSNEAIETYNYIVLWKCEMYILIGFVHSLNYLVMFWGFEQSCSKIITMIFEYSCFVHGESFSVHRKHWGLDECPFLNLIQDGNI